MASFWARLLPWRRRRHGDRRRIGRSTGPVDEGVWAAACAAGLPPAVAGLPAPDRERLRERTAEFLAAKRFEGCGGLVLTEAMKLHIAAQASLLVLELGIRAFSGFSTVLVYPSGFRSKWTFDDDLGLEVEEDVEQLGESWPGGPVILNWADASGVDAEPSSPEAAESELEATAFNLVLHEFAHKLDVIHGEADGEVPLPDGADLAAWGRAIEAARSQIERIEADGMECGIDGYAAESAVECFAVFSEAFFETPEVVAEGFPEVYDVLRSLYRQDPFARATGS